MARKTASGHINGVTVLVFIIGIAVGMIVLSPYVLETTENQITDNCANDSITQQNVTLVGTRWASAHIIAVSADTNEGLIGTAIVEILEGRGRVLISANPFVEPDTQQSISIAKDVAENFTGISLDNVDIIASFDMPMPDENGTMREAELVGGPSAGAALALAVIAATLNATVRSDVAITGTILPDGRIGTIGSVLEKATAAGEAGMKMLIVPKGQANVTYYEKTEVHESTNGFKVTKISYVPKTLSLNEYAQQWNMTVVEAATIDDAVKYAIPNLAIALTGDN